MTFTEAALEVLEREGRPMHSKEIAEKAVEWELLSHVGKTPVQTMSARLSAAVARGKGHFERVRPGVYALAKWEGKAPGPSKPPKPKPAPKPEPEEKAPEAKDDPPEDKAEEGASGAPVSPSKKRRRRRRRKKAADEETQQAEAPAADKPPQKQSKAKQDKGKQDKGKQDKGKQDKGKPEKKDKKDGKDAKAGAKTAEKRKSKPEGEPQPRRSSIPPDARRQDDEDLAARVEELLRRETRPVPADKLAAKVGLSGKRATALLEAVLAADGIDHEARGARPRFVQHRSGWALVEREVAQEIFNLEREVAAAADKLSRAAERQILKKIRGLSDAGFARVMAVYLARSRFGEIEPVDRGGAGELHLSVRDRRHQGRFRTAIAVRRDAPGKPLGDQAVVELRGSLHRYDAMSAMIVTTGTVGEAAAAEARVPNLPPVALVDGESLARDMVRLGTGVQRRQVSLSAYDDGFFSKLGG